MTDSFHVPVLAQEVADLIAPILPGVVVDATFGGGGHSRRLLEQFGGDVTLFGIDRDPEAVALGRASGATVSEGNFGDLADVVSGFGDQPVAAVLFDFGVSSHQLDVAARGFSYRHDGPLDMRMGPDAAVTASDVVNEWSEEKLEKIIRDYGEEQLSRRIARAIVRNRPYQSTSQVATTIADAMPAARRRAGHPARRTFQAIRMAVNEELQAIESALDQATDLIQPGGRVIAISYHSLEDRLVKRRFAAGAEGCTCPPDLPVCGCGNTAEFRLLNRRPIRPSDAEVARNPRARSAKLRAAEKIAS